MQKRSLKELIHTEDPAWPLLQEWINTAGNTVEVLKTERVRAEKVLLYLQVTTRSPLGAVAFETGGLLIDHGWLRFLGSGDQRLSGNLHLDLAQQFKNLPEGTPIRVRFEENPGDHD